MEGVFVEVMKGNKEYIISKLDEINLTCKVKVGYLITRYDIGKVEDKLREIYGEGYKYVYISLYEMAIISGNYEILDKLLSRRTEVSTIHKTGTRFMDYIEKESERDKKLREFLKYQTLN